MSSGALEEVLVRRVRWPGEPPWWPGRRLGDAAVFDWRIPPPYAEDGPVQRSYLLLEECWHLNEPVLWPDIGWRCDLVRIVVEGDRISMEDLFVDVTVLPSGGYRVDDLHELAQAARTGERGVTPEEALRALDQTQAFLDRHLTDGAEFPPEPIRELASLPPLL